MPLPRARWNPDDDPAVVVSVLEHMSSRIEELVPSRTLGGPPPRAAGRDMWDRLVGPLGGREFFWVSPGLSSSLGEVFVDELDGDGSLADGGRDALRSTATMKKIGCGMSTHPRTHSALRADLLSVSPRVLAADGTTPQAESARSTTHPPTVVCKHLRGARRSAAAAIPGRARVPAPRAPLLRAGT